MRKITILTPTFNRSANLKNLFSSLMNQTIKDFSWLIIDDGSTDDTEKVVSEFKLLQPKFSIDYIYKVNGGKHRAMNASHPYIKTDWVMVVDSDDLLVENAIEIITGYAKEWINDPNVGSLIFERSPERGAAPFVKFPDEISVNNRHRYFMDNKLSGDVLDVFKTDVFTSYPLPEFENENFLSEGSLYYLISRKYKSVFYDVVLLVGDYVGDGLTKNIFKKRFESAKGFAYDSGMYIEAGTPLVFRFRKSLLFVAYGLISGAKLNSFLKTNWVVLLSLLPGMLLAKFITWTYRKGQ